MSAAPRVVVVSGGGTGMGRAIAQAFADAGDQVVVIGRRADVLERAAAELSAEPLVADLTEPEQVRRVKTAVQETHGRVDVLVACAGGNVLLGGNHDEGDELQFEAWHWLENFRSNVLTAVLLVEALRDLLTSPGARVVLVSSIAAYRGSGRGSYAGAKAALHPYAYDLAADLGPKGITVNVVAPGYISGTEFFTGGLRPEREKALIDETLTERAGTPEDVAEAVLWLAAPESGQVTAQIVQVNGGALLGR
jgi:NAD(P)-dependent dehydrogenase (short-subunit alcohol dehydrogenase family)